MKCLAISVSAMSRVKVSLTRRERPHPKKQQILPNQGRSADLFALPYEVNSSHWGKIPPVGTFRNLSNSKTC